MQITQSCRLLQNNYAKFDNCAVFVVIVICDLLFKEQKKLAFR